MSLEIGQILKERYKITKLLGAGGFGAVYQAWDLNLSGQCAVKENNETSEAARSQFAREASILYNLRHNNLPRVIDHFSVPGQGQYLVMDYIEGQDLQEKLAQAGGPLPQAQVLTWIRQVCDALTYLHTRTPPIIHRDIKPANIRITPEGSAVLVDFGVAKLFDPQRRTTLGARAITPGYSPFEQYGQKTTDARTDVYALGATLYHLLTGHTPQESLERISGTHLPSPTSRNPEILPHVETAILRAMELMPENRFQTIAEFSAALAPPSPVFAQVEGGEKAPEPVAPYEVQPSKPPPDLKATVKVDAVPSKPVTPAEAPSPPPDDRATVKVDTTPPAPPAKAQAVQPAEPSRKGGRSPVVMALAGLLGLVVLAGLAWGGYSLLAGEASTPTAVPPTHTVAPPTQPAVVFECQDAIGCVEIGPGEPIHIAYALVVAGPNESLGIDARNGLEIAIEAKRLILGHEVRLTGEDTGCNPEVGQSAAAKLSADPSIVAIIGTSCSSEARVAMPLFSKAGFTVISPSNTAPDLTEPGNVNQYPGYLRTAHNDIVQGPAAANFAKSILPPDGLTAATIHDGSLYAAKLAELFALRFTELGGQMAAQEAFDPNQIDFGPLLTRISADRPSLIYFPVFLPAGGYIIRQARQTPGLENVILMGADGLFTPDVVEAAGEAVEGFYVSSPFLSGPEYDLFLGKYKEKYGLDPISIFHAHAYDAFMMLAAAIEKVAIQGPDGRLLIPRQSLRDAMYATKDFHGKTGLLSCSPTGDCANPVIAVYQYHAAQYPPIKVWP